MYDIHGRVTSEIGAKLRTALNAFDHPDPQDTPTLQRRRPDQRLADALAAMTDAVLNHGLAPATGGIARPHISVHVDIDTINADLSQPEHDEHGDPVVDHDGNPVTRDAPVAPDDPAWTGPQRSAINARDRGCRGPNCTRPIAWTAIHHIAWWTRDHGRTDLDNGLALCHHCHNLIHTRNWQITLDPDTAAATWTSPTGTTTTTMPHQPDATAPHQRRRP